MNKAALILLLIGSQAQAGMFLDLDLGTPIGKYVGGCATESATVTQDASRRVTGVELNCEGNYIGSTGMLGIVRVGYQTRKYRANWVPNYISAHAYFMHISDPAVSDGGLDMIAAGVRIQ